MHREHQWSHGPHWRGILEARWRERLQEVTELSMAYHGAAAGTASGLENRRTFEDSPWAGLLIAFGAATAVSLAVEGARRLHARRTHSGHPSRGHAGQAEAGHPGEDQRDRHQLPGRHRVTEENHAGSRGSRGAGAGPDRLGGPGL